MSTVNSNDFIHMYNPNQGKFQYRHYSGGDWFDSLNIVTPSLMSGGSTGVWNNKQVKNVVPVSEMSGDGMGEEIIKNLRKKYINKSKVEKLMSGKGLRIQ